MYIHRRESYNLTSRYYESSCSAENSDFGLLFLLRILITESTPAANTLFPGFYGYQVIIVQENMTMAYEPSHTLSSSAFRFFAAISSSFFFASRPSLARFIFTALQRSVY